MKCLVLGGTGFLGEYLCESLLKAGHRVRVYGFQASKQKILKLKYPEIQCFVGDFTKDQSFETVVEDIQCVFHLISTTSPSNIDAGRDILSNVFPTIRLLDASVKCGVEKFIFISSGGTVYGIPSVTPIVEGHETNPICSYGVQKLIIEKYLYYYKHNFNLNYAVIRLSNPYGIGQNPYGGQGVIAAFLARALLRQPIQIWGNTKIIRDFLYVEDAMEAILLVLQSNEPELVFNIGSGKGVSLCDIIVIMEGILEEKVQVEYLRGRKQDVPINILDISRAIAILRWSPRTTLSEGISRMIRSWDRKQRCFLKI